MEVAKSYSVTEKLIEDSSADSLETDSEIHSLLRSSASSAVTNLRSVRNKDEGRRNTRSYPHLLQTLVCSCKLTKVSIALVVFHFIISTSYGTVLNALTWGMYSIKSAFISLIVVYSVISIITLFSPLSGFLADVWCTRHRVLKIAVSLMFISFLLATISVTSIFASGSHIWRNLQHFHTFNVYLVLSSGASFLLYFLSLSTYLANFIQFGLDQLLEAPSTTLAIFIHLIMWVDNLGNFLIQVAYAAVLCTYQHHDISAIIFGTVHVIVLTFSLFIIAMIFCVRRSWFYSQPCGYNPYKTVVKVFKFAWKHKYPIQRSAFTYSDDEEPSRLDFAKERYGGPFTTEQVEDVKTLFRILVVMVALAPLFVLETPRSLFLSILFGLHTGKTSAISHQKCTSSFIMMGKGSINNFIPVVVLPFYICWISSNQAPAILKRLAIASALFLLGVLSMFCIDLTGHVLQHIQTENSGGSNNRSMCMFLVDRDFAPPTLDLHWAVLLIPGALSGIGQSLVMATMFEFISAQSPTSMKGLLVGVFLTVRAFCQLISSIALVPFSQTSIWDTASMREHPPVTNCGFGYFLFVCLLALIGVTVFLVVAKWYRLRDRDDRPYDQRFAVDVYSRYIQQALENNVN